MTAADPARLRRPVAGKAAANSVVHDKCTMRNRPGTAVTKSWVSSEGNPAGGS